MVLAAGGTSAPGARDALSALCEAYWYPLYVFVRRQGHPHEEACDLTQGFFLDLIEKRVLRGVEPQVARFRSFLLGTLKHYLAHVEERRAARKRGGSVAFMSIDADDAERRYRLDPADDRTPEMAYERHWAATVADRARLRLRREFERAGKGEEFRSLGGLVTGEGPTRPYREVAHRLGTTEAAVKMAVRRLRQRFGKLLRAEIADTVDEERNVDGELRHLVGLLREA